MKVNQSINQSIKACRASCSGGGGTTRSVSRPKQEWASHGWLVPMVCSTPKRTLDACMPACMGQRWKVFPNQWCIVKGRGSKIACVKGGLLRTGIGSEWKLDIQTPRAAQAKRNIIIKYNEFVAQAIRALANNNNNNNNNNITRPGTWIWRMTWLGIWQGYGTVQPRLISSRNPLKCRSYPWNYVPGKVVAVVIVFEFKLARAPLFHSINPNHLPHPPPSSLPNPLRTVINQYVVYVELRSFFSKIVYNTLLYCLFMTTTSDALQIVFRTTHIWSIHWVCNLYYYLVV